MKKTALGIAIAGMMFVSSAQAAVTIYEKDGVKWKFGLDFQVQIRQNPGVDEDSFVDYDDAEIKNRLEYDLGGGVTAFGQADYDLEGESSQETYVGVDFGAVQALLGDTDLPTDAFGNEKAWESPGFDDAFPTSSSDNQVQVKYKIAKGLKISAATDVEDQEEQGNFDIDPLTGLPTSIFSDTEVGFDVQFDANFVGGWEIEVAYQDADVGVGADLESIGTFGVALAGKVGPVKFGIDYSDSDLADLEVLHFSTGFGIAPKTKLAIGYETAESIVGDLDSWYVNVTYKPRKKVTFLAEISDVDIDDSDIGYVLGMRVQL